MRRDSDSGREPMAPTVGNASGASGGDVMLLELVQRCSNLEERLADMENANFFSGVFFMFVLFFNSLLVGFGFFLDIPAMYICASLTSIVLIVVWFLATSLMTPRRTTRSKYFPTVIVLPPGNSRVPSSATPTSAAPPPQATESQAMQAQYAGEHHGFDLQSSIVYGLKGNSYNEQGRAALGKTMRHRPLSHSAHDLTTPASAPTPTPTK